VNYKQCTEASTYQPQAVLGPMAAQNDYEKSVV
jgi:hypothetical protein